MSLKVDNLSHWYADEDQRLYENINLEFEDGNFYSIVGESGSGKTTMLSFLAGLDVPKKGDIRVNGASIYKIGLTKYRQKYVSTIYQAYNLLKTMTAYQNIETALEITDSRHRGDKKFILNSLESVGISRSKAMMSIQKLSGGEQQRVAIVRALLVDAKIVLADEPTGNLDHDNSQLIVNLFKELASEYGKTVIMITHDDKLAQQADIQIKLQKNKFEVIS
ncbi:ABC transporter ATP-binding protein [Weissella koreensis]|uniref:ABC transporter ATP-binding protein n=1 Tax=Weissella koreensis TaxID=165096 RepID=A0A7H1MLI7_9LACO|nr:ABC transporter ATP-binding protein [Weissella koreensis]AEJ23485.1 peptide ABC transporter ATPase [Weissella koreensis KACC 15510]AVH75119.1 ABC transporter ATP-binding protein [Weissella koreensis]EJF33530.1 ABC superfamily ATP binding cassette transporter, ABC protein [Weissella koreensis KCTC 3621]MCZ9310980.1 ABC transporter ATP-binding protein [Weissella koreensis]QGN20345.1 ATP-binding cassette domain-containing protein [Weissella koreensis]